MFERMMDWFLGRGRLRATGSLITRGAAFVLMVGAVCRLLTHLPLPKPGSVRPLAEVLPNLPTWWIPESGLGFVFVAAIAAYGVWLVFEGKKLDRVWAA